MNDSLGNIKKEIVNYIKTIISPMNFDIEVFFDNCYITINDYSITMFLVKKIISFLYNYDYYLRDIWYYDNYFKINFISGELKK